MPTRPLLRSLSVLLVLAVPFIAHAAWVPNGTPICTAAQNQLGPYAIEDGVGGTLIAWNDHRSGNNDVYVQKVDGSGVAQWTGNGVAVRTGAGGQYLSGMVSDGAGGAVIAFYNALDGGIYAQRIDASGALLWSPSDGVLLCNTPGTQQSISGMISDGAGGALIAFFDDRAAGYFDVFAQRIYASGSVAWSLSGVILCAAAGDQAPTGIAPDGNGGAIVSWDDNRSPVTMTYAQRVDGAGNVLWANDGVLELSTGTEGHLVTDGNAGAIVVTREPAVAQRIRGSDGLPQWGGNGVPIAGSTSYPPAVVTDVAGGAIVAWTAVQGGSIDILAQEVDHSGNLEWAPGGIPICTATGDQIFPTLVAPPSGGALVMWVDSRYRLYDIYAQRINYAGVTQWAQNGIKVASPGLAGDQSPWSVSDGSGGAVITWEDNRSGNRDVYASRVNAGGFVVTPVSGATPAASLSVSNNFPNPFSSQTSFDVTLAHESPVSVEVFDVNGRRVREFNEGEARAGALHVDFDGTDQRHHPLPGGVYFLRVHAGAETVTHKMVIER